jgi:hypothetical protein
MALKVGKLDELWILGLTLKLYSFPLRIQGSPRGGQGIHNDVGLQYRPCPDHSVIQMHGLFQGQTSLQGYRGDGFGLVKYGADDG